MKNYGWDKVIDAVNVRVPNGVSSELSSDEPQAPAEAEIPAESAEPKQRDAIIFNVCRSFGMPELAASFIGDSRSLPEIMHKIYASKIQMQASKMARGCFGNWVGR